MIASGESVPRWAAQHVEACDDCAERIDLAAILLNVEPIRAHQASPDRVRHIMDRLCAAGAVDPEPERGASIRAQLTDGGIWVRQTDTEVHITRKVATRGSDAASDLPGVAFFRQFGHVEVELHLIRSGARFHLVVGIGGAPDVSSTRVALHRAGRQLGLEPAEQGSATFKSLRPGAYRVEIRDQACTIGFVDVEVEGVDQEVPR